MACYGTVAGVALGDDCGSGVTAAEGVGVGWVPSDALPLLVGDGVADGPLDGSLVGDADAVELVDADGLGVAEPAVGDGVAGGLGVGLDFWSESLFDGRIWASETGRLLAASTAVIAPMAMPNAMIVSTPAASHLRGMSTRRRDAGVDGGSACLV